MTISSYPVAPETDANEAEHRRKLAKIINSVRGGKMNAVSTVTLTANASSTTLTDSRLTVQSYIGLMPQTANAATALATTYIPASTMLKGSAVIQHANNAQTDRAFTLVIIG